ncbi:MAG: glycosyltransferase [Candidatus Elarobacter sp.]
MTTSSLEARSAARFGSGAEPVVTVIVPVFNKWSVTRRALDSLVSCDLDVALQIVVVDDASSDTTPAALGRIPGIDVVRNGCNAGFVDACNRGALLARGRFLLFLNNDTEVRDDSVRALVRQAESDHSIGIVGSKLVYPDGRLQEAGGIIWSDASGWNYGRFDSPARPEYNFVRDVDYVSGASLLVRTELFRTIGGFDRRYVPAYYEDVDLCFEARARGYRVVYEPRSVVIHHEGVSSGTNTSTGVKRFQEVNKPKFHAKWAEVLEQHHAPSEPANVRAAARSRGPSKGGILVIDSYVPLYDKEAGSNRLRHLIEGFIDAGKRVVFLPDNVAAMQPYTAEMQARGIEVLYHSDGDSRRAMALLADALPTVELAWVCRPELCAKYLPAIRALSSIPILYDTIDLHFVRLRRQAEVEGSTDDASWRAIEDLELTCGRAANGTVVVSAAEADVLRAAGIAPIAVVPTIHDIEPALDRPFTATEGLLFIGGYNHVPNIDAAVWLVRDIMPAVWAALPGVHLTLLGANPPASVLALAGERVTVPGYVRDVDPYFRAARIFVAPLRYGAGVKGKIGHALSYELPTITTSIGSEGFDFEHGATALIADDAEAFAASIVSLYENPVLWRRLATGAAEALRPFSRERVVRSALDFIDDLTTPAPALAASLR